MTTVAPPANGVMIPTCTHCRDQWMWIIRYRDNTILAECYGGQAPHPTWANVNVPMVLSMAWVPRRDGLPHIVLDVPEGAKPVVFRRRYVELNIQSEQTVGQQNIHCIGYERDGGNSFIFAFEDGSVLVTPNRNAV